MALIQLIYVSTLSEGFLEDEIAKILACAVKNNRESGVTGMLLYSNGNFMQVLEGESEAVLETYARICRDPRHHDLVELSREAITTRDFSQWSMGYHGLCDADIERFPDYAPFFKFGFLEPAIQARPGIALELLQQFSAENC